MYGTSDPYCWVKTSNKVAGGVVVTIGGFSWWQILVATSWLAGWWKFNQRRLMARQVADGVCMGSVHFHGLHCLSCSRQWFGALDPSISSMTFQNDMGFHMYSILAPSSPPKNYGGKPDYKLSPEYIYIYKIIIHIYYHTEVENPSPCAMSMALGLPDYTHLPRTMAFGVRPFTAMARLLQYRRTMPCVPPSKPFRSIASGEDHFLSGCTWVSCHCFLHVYAAKVLHVYAAS